MVGRRHAGFTLIELLVALAIMSLLMSLVLPRYFGSLARAEEIVLKENLALLRDALDKHFGDTGKYPASIEELVSNKYLRAVPVDPITQSATTWVAVPPADASLGGVSDVRSGATGGGRDGKPYEHW